jgi:hypothetical protein
LVAFAKVSSDIGPLCGERWMICSHNSLIAFSATEFLLTLSEWTLTPLVSLKDHHILQSNSVRLDIGHAENVNKNSVAEKAIRELWEQIIHLSPHRGPISELTLAKATNYLNSLI